MIKKVKILTSDRTDQLEECLNQWLELNPYIIVHDIKYTSTSIGSTIFFSALVSFSPICQTCG